MLSLLEVLERSTAFFEQKGVPNARLQAEWIFAHVLGCGRLDLYLRFEQPLEESLLERLRPLVARRARREPLQYVLGTTPFADLKLRCDRRALIPRPETEMLVEEIAARQAPAPGSILDLGTGTGAIALALAQKWPEAKVSAADFSKDALTLAAENAEANGLDGHVHFLQSDWFSSVEGLYDVIVSNPPYLTREEWECADPEVRDYEPYDALVAENGGLADLERILREAGGHLNPGGMLALETGIAHHPALTALAGECGYASCEGVKDLSGRARFFFARKSA